MSNHSQVIRPAHFVLNGDELITQPSVFIIVLISCVHVSGWIDSICIGYSYEHLLLKCGCLIHVSYFICIRIVVCFRCISVYIHYLINQLCQQTALNNV